MVLKKGRFGTFFACTGYPDCKTTKQIGGAQKKPTFRWTRNARNAAIIWSRSTAVSANSPPAAIIPACKYVKQKTIGVKCPECSEGEVVERRSKRGKTFYGCNRYPDCDFRGMGEARAGEVPGLRQSLSRREISQSRRISPVPECGVQV